METLHLVDGSGYVFRAYHAIKPMRNAAGEPIHAVLGFTRMLVKLIKEHRPAAMGVVFDAGRRTFRTEIYPEYKANRDAPPDDLRVQVPHCVEAVEALGLRMLRVENVEADDVLATLVRQARAAGQRVVIVTGDKDLMQLVGPDVTILRYNARSDTEELVDEEGVKKYFGVGPAQVADVLALMGDTSDNVPGVDGIGEKSASELIAQHGSLEAVLAAAPSMKPGKRRDTLVAQQDRARLSKQLVVLKDDVELPLGPADLQFSGLDVERSRTFFSRMGFKALLADPMFAPGAKSPAPAAASMPAPGSATDSTPTTAAPASTTARPRRDHPDQGSLFDARPTPPAAAPPPPASTDAAPEPPTLLDLPPLDGTHHRVIADEAGLAAILASAEKADHLGVELIASGPDAMRASIVGVALCWAPGHAAYVPVKQAGDLLAGGVPVAALRERLGPLLARTAARAVGHGCKDQVKLLAQHDFGAWSPADDVELASYVLARAEVHDLHYVAQRTLRANIGTLESVAGKGKTATPVERVPVEAMGRHACQRADAVVQALPRLLADLRADSVETLYRELEMPLAGVLAAVEQAGVCVDPATLHELAQQARAECVRLEAECHALAGAPFNLASPKQLADVLFNKLGLPVQRKTKTGPSTDVDVLEELSELHPLPSRVLEHRHLQKLVGTYLEALPQLIHPRTGRIHTTYHQAVAATGRLSSQDPNLQNIPIRDERGRRIRGAFKAAPGCVLVSADYSQIELRILAHVTRDPVLLAAFERGEDVHARTASEVLGIPLQDVTRDQRRAAKTINFGLLYGMSAFGLSRALRIPRAQAKEYLERYFARLTGVSAWQEQVVQEARERGWVQTLFGRRRYLPDITQRNSVARQAAERMAINTPIQGAAADIIKRAMVDLHGRLAREAPGARMILQVHDELVVECPSADAEHVIAVMRAGMEGAAHLDVRLEVDAGSGTDWGQAHA